MSRLVLLAVFALVIAAAGCSRSPKPTAAVAAPAPRPDSTALAEEPAGPFAEDTLVGKKAPAKPKSNGGSAARPPVAEPVPVARSGGSSSAPAAAAPDTTALLEPALTAEERAKLEEKTKTTIAEARAKLENVDAARLDAERLRKYRLANDYLTEAVRARDDKDLQRASSLAHKAKLLAEEL